MTGSFALVIPTVREHSMKCFLDAWAPHLSHSALTAIIVVEDNPEKSFHLECESAVRAKLYHYCWRDIDEDLGNDSWIIPRRTDCIRSYGYWKAFQAKVEFIITLDDDCYPCGSSLFEEHVMNLRSEQYVERWLSTFEGRPYSTKEDVGYHPRGVPYYESGQMRSCGVSHGMWTQVPDYDAVTQLQISRRPLNPVYYEGFAPFGQYFPMCGMNLAWRRELTPAMYFLLMGKGHPFDRSGDIWAGVILKKIMDHLGYVAYIGRPYVEHQRASNGFVNLRKEAPAMEYHELFWQWVDGISLMSNDVRSCYMEIANRLQVCEGEHQQYWRVLKKAMATWVGLFADES